MTFIYILIAGIVIVIDQVSKYLVVSNEALHNMTIIEGFFHITYLENTGAAWSMMSNSTTILTIISLVASIAMIAYLFINKPDKLTSWALALMIGGALGNFIDRLLLGYVRDFLDFYIFGYDFPVFNIADTSLCIGVGLLILATILGEKENADTDI